MLIKNLFNLETNITANFPNQYFVVLEKQEKYKELTQRVSMINQFQKNISQSMSTIKITFIQLIHNFFKPQENSELKKIEHALLCSFDTINQVCLNLTLKVESLLNNYQREIDKLSKKYKEQLQQTVHYKKKVESIRKNFLQNREDKQKLQRNIDKKRIIQKECRLTEKLLAKNYENFQIQAQKLLQQCPQQILLQFIEGNFIAYSNLSQIIGQEKYGIRNRQRQASILSAVMSEISDLDGSDKLSQYDGENFPEQDEIRIIIEPQSTEEMENGSQVIQIVLNQEPFQNEQNLKASYYGNKHSQKDKRKKKQFLRKSSIEYQIKNKQNLLQKVKKIINAENKNLKKQQLTPIDEVFQKIQPPLSQQSRKRNIFSSLKNRFSENPKKIKILQKKVLNFSNDFHEKSFILTKQEFKKNHTPKNLQKQAGGAIKNYLKCEETLNQPIQNEDSSDSNSKNQKNSNVSLSSILKKNEQKVNQNVEIFKKGCQTQKYLKTEPPQNILKHYSYNRQDQKILNKKEYLKKYAQLQIDIERQHTHSNFQTKFPQNQTISHLKSFQQKKHSNKLGKQQKSRVIQQLFSFNPLKTKKNHENSIKRACQINGKELDQSENNTKKVDRNNLFSTTFLYPYNNKEFVKSVKSENTQKFNDTQNTEKSAKKTKKSPQIEKKIDFSIFSKIV